MEALRKYEHASEEQVAKVSQTLAGHGVSPKCSEISCPATFVGTLSGCFSAASLNGCSFSNCTVNFVTRPFAASKRDAAGAGLHQDDYSDIDTTELTADFLVCA